MIDIDELLRADAERWREALVAVADLDVLAVGFRRTPRRRYLVPALAAAAVVAFAVALSIWVARPPTKPSQPPPHAATGSLSDITGVVWEDTASPGTVVFTDSTMRVFDGCGNGLYDLVIRGDTLAQGAALGPGSSCSGPGIPPGAAGAAMRAAQRRLALFMSVVHGPAVWSRSGYRLTLATPGVGKVTLTTDSSAAPEAVGTRWELAYYGRHVAPRPFRLHIDEDGRFIAEYACGSLTGNAAASPTAIEFGDPHGGGCAGSADASSDVILQIVGERVTYEVRGAQLFLHDEAGRLLVYDAVG